MEGCCSTGQSPQWAVVPVKDEEEETTNFEESNFLLSNSILECKKRKKENSDSRKSDLASGDGRN
jgi:hypothetical protein